MTTDSDVDDGTCDDHYSLREAINSANTDASGIGPDQYAINFDPTFFNVPRTINLTGALPGITAELSW